MTDLIIRAAEPDAAAALTSLANLPGYRGAFRLKTSKAETSVRRRRRIRALPQRHLALH